MNKNYPASLQSHPLQEDPHLTAGDMIICLLQYDGQQECEQDEN